MQYDKLFDYFFIFNKIYLSVIKLYFIMLNIEAFDKLYNKFCNFISK